MRKTFLIPALIIAIAATVVSFAPTPVSSSMLPAPVVPPRDQAPIKWTLDKVHSGVLFSVAHLVVSDVEGSFKSFDGSMENTKPDFSDATISFVIDVNSVSTDNENRDKHLKSNDFFNVDSFPQMKFISTSFKPVGDNKYKLMGYLTIRNVTKPVIFDVNYGGQVNAMGGTHAGFKAKTTINRFDYNLKWDRATEAGGLVVGKDVDITINIDMKKS
jgi:polyisoprenoid-binding protein YceI